jgi:Cu-Zn family superoxide dismutase
MAVLTDRFAVSEVLGKAVVLHRQPDDFHTQPAGNAGAKIACGLIERFGR